MTSDDLKNWRKAAGLTQSGLAALIGLSLRAVQEIEAAPEPLRPIHQLAVDMGSMHLAAERRTADVLTDSALRVFLGLEPLVTDEQRAAVLSPANAPALNAAEQAHVDLMEQVAGRKLTGTELRDYVTKLRTIDLDYRGRPITADAE